jgi:hypothetical protein
MLTLFTTPVIYLAFDRLGRWLGWQRPQEPDDGETDETVDPRTSA